VVDVYRVGITLAMAGNASSALSHQFTGLHASAQQINNQGEAGGLYRSPFDSGAGR
jgi:hypothetical protein